MTKRGQWVLTCWLWAALWFIAGLFFFPFWLLSLLSVMMILIPVGTPETPSVKHYPNPSEWSKHNGDGPRA